MMPSGAGMLNLTIGRLRLWWRRDLFVRLYVGIVALVLLSTMGYTVYAVANVRTTLHDELESRARNLSDVLVLALARPLFDINSQAVDSVVRAVGATPDVVALRVRTSDQRIMALSGDVVVLDTDSDAVVKQLPITFTQGGRVYPVGDVGIALSQDSTRAEMRQRMTQTLFTSWSLAALIMLALFVVGRRLDRPFADIRRALDQLAAGEVDITLTDTGRDDQIGRLSRAVLRFRDVLAKLQETERALRDLNVGLEQRVQASTQDLRETVDLLSESRSKLQAVVDTALDAVIRTDPQGRVLDWNPMASRLFGWTIVEALDQNLIDMVVPASEREARQGALLRLSQEEGSAGALRKEVTAQNRQGREFPVEWSVSRVVLPGTSAVELCFFVRDLTERKRAEEDTRAALRRQAELLELRSRFVAMASHEFRTPLTAILSSVELMRHYADRLGPGEQEQLLVGVEHGVQRMTHLLDRVLVVGKADAQRLEFAPKPLDLAEVCRDVLKEARTQHDNSTCEVLTHFDPEPGLGRWDEHLLRHILGNLVGNAFKYSPQGGKIRFGYRMDDTQVVFTVADQGIGIPEEDLEHLFESFHRSKNVGDIPGTGLGLSIVRSSVELHGGHIEVDSTQGEGTCFTVTLPLQN